MTATAPAPRSALRTILLVAGSVVLVAILGYIVIAVVANSNRSDASREVTFTEAFDELTVDVGVADVVVEYAAVDEATVDFRQNGSSRSYDFDADLVGSTLEVRVVDRWSGFWWPFGNPNAPVVTITLPDPLDGVDLTIESSVGDVALDGLFGDVELSSSVGDVRLEGAARTVHIDTSVGDITALSFAVTGDLTIDSSTGDVTLDLTDVPSLLDVSSNVGDQMVTLPEGRYRVEAESGVGDLNVHVDNDSDADTLLRFESSVGNITVRN